MESIHSPFTPYTSPSRAVLFQRRAVCLLIMLEDMLYHVAWSILEGLMEFQGRRKCPPGRGSLPSEFGLVLWETVEQQRLLGPGEEKCESAPGFAQEGASIPHRQSASTRSGSVRMSGCIFYPESNLMP